MSEGIFELPKELEPLFQKRLPGGIYHISAPGVGKFEYHEDVKTLFYVLGTTGIQCAHGIKDAYEARICALLWGRGYIQHRTEKAIADAHKQ